MPFYLRVIADSSESDRGGRCEIERNGDGIGTGSVQSSCNRHNRDQRVQSERLLYSAGALEFRQKQESQYSRGNHICPQAMGSQK